MLVWGASRHTPLPTLMIDALLLRTEGGVGRPGRVELAVVTAMFLEIRGTLPFAILSVTSCPGGHRQLPESTKQPDAMPPDDGIISVCGGRIALLRMRLRLDWPDLPSRACLWHYWHADPWRTPGEHSQGTARGNSPWPWRPCQVRRDGRLTAGLSHHPYRDGASSWLSRGRLQCRECFFSPWRLGFIIIRVLLDAARCTPYYACRFDSRHHSFAPRSPFLAVDQAKFAPPASRPGCSAPHDRPARDSSRLVSFRSAVAPHAAAPIDPTSLAPCFGHPRRLSRLSRLCRHPRCPRRLRLHCLFKYTRLSSPKPPLSTVHTPLLPHCSPHRHPYFLLAQRSTELWRWRRRTPSPSRHYRITTASIPMPMRTRTLTRPRPRSGTPDPHAPASMAAA